MSRPEDLASRLRLMLVTEPRPRSGLPLGEMVERALEGGVTAVQVRHKGAEGGELLRATRELAAAVRRHGALLLVNDRPDVALAAGADGVHLGPEDLPVSAVRRFVPPDFLVGYSTDDSAEGRRAARDGASYLGVGAVYGTRSKEGLEAEAVGPRRVGEILEAAGLPGVGIGGIDTDNAREVARQGAGVAVMGALTGAPDPRETARRLREAVRP